MRVVGAGLGVAVMEGRQCGRGGTAWWRRRSGCRERGQAGSGAEAVGEGGVAAAADGADRGGESAA
ncbi:hypothetical protein GCM10009827_091300 [Dactylosporangium maewongense]|uniref:Uncharacterized protein n=1 Tax=Dactylosporangium maewongense TaxID=634393 RepID=A0ABN2CE51_9ACTN